LNCGCFCFGFHFIHLCTYVDSLISAFCTVKPEVAEVEAPGSG
jgi:hypothetical protein